jgi:hypothetical protein
MSKDVRNSHIPQENVQPATDLPKLAESLIFQPGPLHRKWKARFWSKYVPNPLTDVSDCTFDEVNEIIRDSRVAKNWSNQAFREWLFNTDENRERLEYLFTMALDTAEEILMSESAQVSAKVNMIKVLAELANKFPSKNATERYVDDEINKMSELQLKAWLERRGIAPRSTKAIETLPSIDVSSKVGV